MGVAKFLEVVIGGIVTTLVLAAFAWFGGPAIWKHLSEGEAALKTVQVQQAAMTADAGSASRAQANCAAEVDASVKAGAAIARVARPVKATSSAQPMLSSKDIADALQ